MRKYFVIFILMVFLPIRLFAENSIVSQNLEEALKLDNIEANLGNYKESEEKVNIYLFWGNGCPHCKDFLKFVSSELVKDYSEYFNFTAYEVWSNKANSEFMKKVTDAIEAEDATGVPFIVIGEEYFVGYGERLNTTIINVIKDEYSKSSRRDVVKEVLSGNNSLTNSQVSGEDVKNERESNNIKNDNSNFARGEVEDSSKEDGLIKVILVIVGLTLGCIVVILCKPRKVLVDKSRK